MLERYINSRIIYNIMDEDAWTEYLNRDDNVIKKAMEIFRKDEAFPKNKEAVTEKKKS